MWPETWRPFAKPPTSTQRVSSSKSRRRVAQGIKEHSAAARNLGARSVGMRFSASRMSTAEPTLSSHRRTVQSSSGIALYADETVVRPDCGIHRCGREETWLPSQTLFRLFFPDPSLFPRCSNRGIVLAFEHEQRIRALIKAFADEKDPERLKVLAADLEDLLKLESKAWPIRDRQKSA